MTTEQHMLTDGRGRSSAAGRIAVLLAASVAAIVTLGLCGACARQDRLGQPRSLVSPYAGQTDLLWAVAPLRNESGVSVADTLAVSDALSAQIEEVRGLRCLPVNRTLSAMRALDLSTIETPGQALKLAQALGADGIVVGTITAWDPYNPPKFGIALALFSRHEPGSRGGATGRVDPRALQAAASDYGLVDVPAVDPLRPTSTASEHLDGANHEVQAAVRAYAEGRHEERSALGWRRYLASMGLFTEFGCFRLTERLLDEERLRLAQAAATSEEDRSR